MRELYLASCEDDRTMMMSQAVRTEQKMPSEQWRMRLMVTIDEQHKFRCDDQNGFQVNTPLLQSTP
jgi:hypothetical protein